MKNQPQSSSPESSAVAALGALFPLDSIEAVVALFRHIVREAEDSPPNLALLSILLGFFESEMHLQQQQQQLQQQHANKEAADASEAPASPCDSKATSDEEMKEKEKEEKAEEEQKQEQERKGEAEGREESAVEPEFPVLTFKRAESLYQQFVSLVTDQLQEFADPAKRDEKKTATRDIIKAISDFLWKQLARNYQKEKTHIQFLYSFLTESKLDSFGVAYGVVAVSQLLGFSDVTLALSEDHAWVVFGPAGSETAELTWHGRGQEEKRGLAVDDAPDVPTSSWLYLNGHPVLCRTPMMAAAAAVTSLNPDNCGAQLGSLKRRLLWLLHLEAEPSPLQNYPLALLNLADLEAMSPSAPSSPLPGPNDNAPRLRPPGPARPSPEQLYLQAIEVNRRVYGNQHVYPYTYTAGHYHRVGRNAEALKYWADAGQVMSNFNYFREDEEIYKEFREIAYEMLPRLLLQEPSLRHDPAALSNVLRFYDGICQWEEGSVTPVLHTGWADRFMSTLFKFDAGTRRELVLLDAEEELPMGPGGEPSPAPEPSEEEVVEPKEPVRNEMKTEEAEPKRAEPKPTETRISPPVTLEQLKAECGRQLFNPAYLLGLVSSPAFLPPDHPNPRLELAPLVIRPPSPQPPPPPPPQRKTQTEQPPPSQKQQPLPPSPLPAKAPQTKAPAPLASPSPLTPPHSEPGSSTSNASLSPDLPAAPAPLCSLHLRSEKMRGLKALLTGPRLNASAIKLQLTAQSQIYLRRTDLDSAYPLPRKRARRG